MKILREKEFWDLVEKTDDCWIWKGGKNSGGYGNFSFDKERGVELSHRISWKLICGIIPKGVCVLHHCDNPACVKADLDPSKSHLFLGTYKDNTLDSIQKGRTNFFGRKGGDKMKKGNKTQSKEAIMFLVSQKEKIALKKRAEEIGIGNMSGYLRMLVYKDIPSLIEKEQARR